MSQKELKATKNAYHTIIVGGGIAGLTAAAYVARSGHEVVLIEKNKELGGLVNTFVHNGFHFDAGVRALEDAGIIFPMLKELGVSIDVVPSPVTLGIEDQLLNIHSRNDLYNYQSMLNSLFPKSSEEIEHLIEVIGEIIDRMDVLYGIENPLFKMTLRNPKYLFQTLLPWLPKFLLTIGKISSMNHPIEAYLKTIISNPSLRDMVAQHFFKGTPTFFALSYFSLYLDYFYPKGGVGKLADGISNKLLELGGTIRTETTITQVNADSHTVVDQNGVTYNYQHLVWAADLKRLYSSLHTDALASSVKQRIEEKKTALLERRGTDSVFSLFLEVDQPLESFRAIANGHIFYTPSREGLGEIHRDELKRLIDNFEQSTKEQVFSWLDRFVRHNTFEISIPALKDPQMAPHGKTGITVSLLAEYSLFAKVRKAGWIEEFVTELEDRMIETLTHSIFPLLKGSIIGRFSFSPLSIERRIGSSEGSIVGWAFETDMPVVNQIHQSAQSIKTPIPDVYQIGQWAYSPAGVPMSILTGRMAAKKLTT